MSCLRASLLGAAMCGMLLGGCTREATPQPASEPASAGGAAAASVREAAASEPQFPPASPQERTLQGSYDLWQDGEGGLSCKLELRTEPILGGKALDAAGDCDGNLKLGGDPYAWFLNADGVLVLIDATRRPLLRLERLSDGSYKDRRDGDYVNAILLTRR